MSLSVISSLSAPRGRPVALSSAATSATSWSRWISPVERLTLTLISPASVMVDAPGRQLACGLAHHVTAKLDQEAHLFQERQELLRRQHAAARVAPAGQRLEAGDGAGVEANDRLEEGHDLAAADGAAQIGLHGEPRQPVALQRPPVLGGAAAAGRLGQLHRDLRPPEQFGGVGRVGPALGLDRADGQRREDVEAGDAQRLLHGPAHQLGRLGDVGRRERRELVLADAGQERVGREGRGQARAERGQHEVGALVPQRLVQAAQAIEIGDHQAVAAGGLQQLPRAANEAAPVEQAGQRILIGRREVGLGHDDAGGAHAVLEPFAAPDAGVAATHPDAGADLAAGLLDLEDVVDQRTILRHGQRAHGGGRALGREWRQTQPAGGASQAQAVGARVPTPQRDGGGAQGLQGHRRIPNEAVLRFRRHQPPAARAPAARLNPPSASSWRPPPPVRTTDGLANRR